MKKQNRREFLLSLGIGAVVAPLAVKAVSHDSLESQMEAFMQRLYARFDRLPP